MKALVFEAQGRTVVGDLPEPSPGPGEVIVASRSVGVCHSDFELLGGRYILPFRYPVVPGHEWSGEVVEVAPDVAGFAPGDRVVGECVVGPDGMEHFGFSISGAAAERFAVRAEWLHLLPDELSFTEGALVEPFSVAYNAVRTARVDAADRVAVLGGGPIGLLALLAATAAGAQVTLVEPRADRRALASHLGCAATVDPSTGLLEEQARAAASGGRFEVVIEAAGNLSAMALAVELAAPRGRLVYLGISTEGTAPVPMGLVQSKALTLTGIVGSVGVWPQAIRFLAGGRVDPARLVTARFGLADALEALASARPEAGNVKVHIESGWSPRRSSGAEPVVASGGRA